MTINTSKYRPSRHDSEGESVVFEQNRKSIQCAIARSCTVFCILMALCGLTSAQSQDPANPTLITTKKVEGKAAGAGATYYYRFKAKTGSVKVTLVGQTNNYSAQFEADLISSSGADLGKIYVSASDQANHALKVFSFDSDQVVDIVVKLTKDDTLKWQYYSIMLSGAVELAANGGQPTPAQPAPDLVVSEIIFEQSPAKIRVRVMNIGSAASASCFLALASGAGDDPSLGTKKRVWSIKVPALEAGKGFSTAVDVSPLTQTNGPWKAIVDRSDTVKESNETNNSLSHPLQ
jgi:CARDB